mmetsp:Transcript_123/g.145  ORF Transcript_123/g.145 Transcript_123/m.145 type:complete len:144 (-) Transcript_123:1366-1797(-)
MYPATLSKFVYFFFSNSICLFVLALSHFGSGALSVMCVHVFKIFISSQIKFCMSQELHLINNFTDFRNQRLSPFVLLQPESPRLRQFLLGGLDTPVLLSIPRPCCYTRLSDFLRYLLIHVQYRSCCLLKENVHRFSLKTQIYR